MEQATQEPVLSIVGEKVALGPIRRDLVPLYQRWMNDFEVTRTLGASLHPFTLEAEEAWYEGASKRGNCARFTLYAREENRPIGNTGLEQIDLANRTAEFGILIGEKACWNKGYGTETARLMLDYGFNVLTLHHIYLRVHSNNARGIRAYTRAGFREAGRLREARRIGRQVHDVILMDCLATEFGESRLAHLAE